MPHHYPYSSAQGDVWALGCILAEMIGNARPWSQATPEDSDYSDYLMDRTVLFDMLPVSHTAYLLLRKIFSTKPEQRPSLAAIRTEVLAMDTFVLTDQEAAGCGADRIEKQMLRKMRARGVIARQHVALRRRPPDPSASRLAAWDRRQHRVARHAPCSSGRGYTYSGQGQPVGVGSARSHGSLADLLIYFDCLHTP